MTDRICSICESVKKQKPLIHCITNPISINGCANVILSVGAKPIMAEHPKEVYEITDTAGALMLNLGNITDVRMESMLISLKRAKERGIPIILDVVGIACSDFRRKYALDLINTSMPSVIKGNYSEITVVFSRELREVLTAFTASEAGWVFCSPVFIFLTVALPFAISSSPRNTA